MNNIVIVGVDGSATAALAAEAAARIAAGLGATLHVVTAVDRSETEVIGVGDDQWVVGGIDDALQTAASAAATLRDTVAEITTGAGEGKPHEVLIEEARRLDARMIVVGNRRMQGIARVLGSVANSVAHNAPCDVYIVKTV